MRFEFSGKTKDGKPTKGTVEAFNKEQAVKVLQEKEIYTTNLVEKEEKGMLQELLAPISKFSKVGNDQIVVFTRQLSTMVSAGLPILQALIILKDQARSSKFREFLKEAIAIIEGGSPLSKAFASFPDVFDTLYVNLIKAGESSGSLDRIFLRLADKYEQRREFRSKVKGAMIYPIIIFSGMVGVVTLMLVFVVPKVTSMYSSMDLDLPLPTKIMISLSAAVIDGWWILAAGILGTIVFLKNFKKTERGKYFFARLSFKIPLIGRININSDLVELTSTLSLLLSSGVPITEALEIVANSMKNQLFKEIVLTAIEDVKKGGALSATFARSEYMPPIVSQMMAVGEETGKVDEILFKLSQYFESETDQIVKNMSTAIEPIVLVMLGGMVGIIVLAIIMPIYKLTSAFE